VVPEFWKVARIPEATPPSLHGQGELDDGGIEDATVDKEPTTGSSA